MKSASSGRGVGDLVAKGGHGRGQQRVQVQRQVFLDQHADHAQRMAAQRKRVLVARGQVADAEHADQGFQLVGQRHHHAGGVARQRVAGKARLVVVFDGIGHVFAQAVVAGVVAAHDALQLGELAHHVGQQVGLGQQRGLVGLLPPARRRPAALRWPWRWRARAPRARPACPACCGRPPCPGPHARGQRLLAVLVEEELGVGQARAHHALVAAGHGAGVSGLMLLTTRNWLVSLPAASSSGKYFWLAFIVRIRHSCGTSRNCSRTGRPARWGARPARSLRRAGRRLRWGGRAPPWRRQRPAGGDLGAALGKAGDHGAVAGAACRRSCRRRQHHRATRGFKAVALRVCCRPSGPAP
jgi:hypothetical protein